MIQRIARLGAVAAVAATTGLAAQAQTTPAQPVDPLLILWPEGTTPPAEPPVRTIRMTWSTGVFR